MRAAKVIQLVSLSEFKNHMNSYELFMSSKGNRDEVFQQVLSHLQKPINIFELGCSRDNSLASRQADGWSSFHFLNHIAKFGGSLTINDIEKQNLQTCQEILSSHPNFDVLLASKQLRFVLGNGLLWLHEPYELVYLDGGDNPNDTLEQFEKIITANCKLSFVLADDFHTKGSILRKKYDTFKLVEWVKNDFQFGIYDFIYSDIPKSQLLTMAV